MKRLFLVLLATLSLVLMMALSAGVAAAGWDYEDCPPSAAAAQQHASDRALNNWLSVKPPANDNAWEATNPGNKANTAK